MVSDYFLISINVYLQKSIGKDPFLADLWVSYLVLDPPDDIDHLVDLNNNSTLSVLVGNANKTTIFIIQ